MSEIDEILRASTPGDIFTGNEKQSRIKYMRLMRSVHPDTHPGDKRAEAAAKRLTMLWSQYKVRAKSTTHNATRSKPKAHPVEVSRNLTHVLFVDGDQWLLVNKKPFDGHDVNTNASTPLDANDTSPIAFTEGRTFLIDQSNGRHLAMRFGASRRDHGHDVPISVSEPAFLIDDLMYNHVKTFEPEDATWLMKRVAYVWYTLAKGGYTVDDWDMMPIVLPRQHFMLMETGNVRPSTDSANLNSWVIATMETIDIGMLHTSADKEKVNAVREFIRENVLFPVGSNEGTSVEMAMSFLGKIDAFSRRTFGGIYFHEMKLS